MTGRPELLVGLCVVLIAAISTPAAVAQQKPPSTPPPNPFPASTETQKSHPKRVRTDLSGFELATSPPSESTQIGGGTRSGFSTPRLYAPRRGKTYTFTPTFDWSKPDSRSDFRFIISDSSGNLVYETNVHGSTFTYPANAPALRPGTAYLWTVQFAGSMLARPAPPAEFVVQSPQERESIQNSLRSITSDSLPHQLARAQIFVDARLWYDSIQTYSELIAKHPDNPDLYDKRGEIYDQIPETHELAQQDFSRADDLRATLQ